MTRQDRRIRDDLHFDRWAKRYDRSWTQSLFFGPVQRSVVAAVVPRLPSSAVILDVGCGTGRLLDQLGTALPSATVVGLDRSAGMARAARRRRPDLWIERGSAEALPHPDGCVDAVMTTISFHHWSDKIAARSEVFRLLRPGGLFALTDVSIDDRPDWPKPLWTLLGRAMDDMPSLQERHRLIKAAGLQVLEVSPTLHRRWITLTLAVRPAA
jgi:ubiquinone/menaquinone biosynthesis C-methylase UbiE